MSKNLFRRVSRLAVVAAASSVVLASGAGMSAAYAADSTSGTNTTATSPQPLSTADQNTGGANGDCITDPKGIYCSTTDGTASGNGNQETGTHTGEPCGGCVGSADNKNPPGQETSDPSGTFPNNGYECDNNNGIGQTNPAHSGCQPTLAGSCVAATSGGGASWVLTNSNGFAVTATWVSDSQTGTVTIPAATPIDNKTSTPGTVTFTTSGTSVKVSFPNNGFTEIDKTLDCPAPPATQLKPLTLSAACGTEAGTFTWTLANPNDVAVPAHWAAGPASGDVSAPANSSTTFTTTTPDVTVSFAPALNLTAISMTADACPQPPATLSLTVVKTNDADTDGAFHDTETAHTAGQDVTFEVRAVNNSPVALVIDSAVDAFSGTSQPECASLVGTTLGAGNAVTCTFTVAGYSPAAGGSLTDTVTVLGHEVGNPGNDTQGSDTSTVLTPTPPTSGAPDLAIVKIASKTSVTAGDALTYTLTVSNVGDAATTGAVTVTDAIPGTLSITGVNGDTDWTCGTSGQTVTCTYTNGAIAPGQTVATITVNTTVLAAATGTLTNTGVVSTPGDTNPTNDTSTVKTPVTKVLGEKIPNTPGTPGTPSTSPATPSAPSAGPDVLPFTGTGVTAALPTAMGLVTAGLLLVVAGIRRRRRA
jgi:uncharacterized repeat protein (TIGR01451 family)